MWSVFSFQDSPAAAYLCTHILFSPFLARGTEQRGLRAALGWATVARGLQRGWVPHALLLSSRKLHCTGSTGKKCCCMQKKQSSAKQFWLSWERRAFRWVWEWREILVTPAFPPEPRQFRLQGVYSNFCWFRPAADFFFFFLSFLLPRLLDLAFIQRARAHPISLLGPFPMKTPLCFKP